MTPKQLEALMDWVQAARGEFEPGFRRALYAAFNFAEGGRGQPILSKAQDHHCACGYWSDDRSDFANHQFGCDVRR